MAARLGEQPQDTERHVRPGREDGGRSVDGGLGVSHGCGDVADPRGAAGPGQADGVVDQRQRSPLAGPRRKTPEKAKICLTAATHPGIWQPIWAAMG